MIDSYDLKDASALSAFSNLKEFTLRSDTLTSLVNLAGNTGMIQMKLECDSLKDIQFIGNMSKLEKLTIDDTQVKDFSLLGNLKRLKKLRIDNNNKVDLLPCLIMMRSVCLTIWTFL